MRRVTWPVEVVALTGSTNADLVARARSGEPGPLWLVAHEQTHGRGRLGRVWSSEMGDSLALSLLLRPGVPQPRWTWLPLLVGLGVVDAVAGLGGVVALKWPNDVVVPSGLQAAGQHGPDGALTGLRKLAGILVEAVHGPGGPAVVVGVGVNLRTPEAQVAPQATSLADLTGTPAAPEAVQDSVVRAVTARVRAWQADQGDPGRGLREAYRLACTTLGRDVEVSTPAGRLAGTAVDVDADGALVLRTPSGPRTVTAGDVVHVR